MNLPKAIENLKWNLDELLKGSDPDTEQAIKLGIQALERHKNRLQLTRREWLEPLPGETED